MKVYNITHLATKNKKRSLENLKWLVIHRSHLAQTGVETAEAFLDKTYGTGGQIPYHFYIQRNGRVEQLVPLSKVAPGALVLNKAGIQVAGSGDFRKEGPIPAQALAFKTLCAYLKAYFPALEIIGHTSVPGTTSDASKECPGKHFNVQGLRELVNKELEQISLAELRSELVEKGVVF